MSCKYILFFCTGVPKVTTPSMYARKYGRDMHKLSTKDVLKLGVIGRGAEGVGGTAYPHRFEKFTNTTPTHCDVCNQLLWSIVRTNSYRCQVRRRCGGSRFQAGAGQGPKLKIFFFIFSSFYYSNIIFTNAYLGLWIKLSREMSRSGQQTLH